MAGLLLKDFKLSLKNKKLFVFIIFIAIAFVLTQGEAMYTFAVSYSCIIFGMMVITTITYDDFNHSNEFLFTLPINRKLYISEKYLFAFLSMIVGGIASVILVLLVSTIKGGVVSPLEFTVGTLGTISVIWVILNIMIPLQLKFGGDNGRIVIVGFVALILIGAFLIEKFAKEFFEKDELAALADKAEAIINNMNTVTIVGIIVVVLMLITGISMAISNGIMKNKEF